MSKIKNSLSLFLLAMFGLVGNSAFAQFDDAAAAFEQKNSVILNRPENRIRDTGAMVSEVKPILRGNRAIGGSLGVAYSSASDLMLFANPTAVYFISDYLALGGELLVNTSRDSQEIGVGPTVHYYFWEHGAWASFVAQSVLYSSLTGSDVKDTQLFSGVSLIGLNYFITPEVAFGANFNLHYSLESQKLEGTYSNLQGLFMVYF